MASPGDNLPKTAALPPAVYRAIEKSSTAAESDFISCPEGGLVVGLVEVEPGASPVCGVVLLPDVAVVVEVVVLGVPLLVLEVGGTMGFPLESVVPVVVPVVVSVPVPVVVPSKYS